MIITSDQKRYKLYLEVKPKGTQFDRFSYKGHEVVSSSLLTAWCKEDMYLSDGPLDEDLVTLKKDIGLAVRTNTEQQLIDRTFKGLQKYE